MSFIAAETDDAIWPLTATVVLRMVESGILDGERVELLDGRLLTVAPQGPEHWSQTRRVGAMLRRAYTPDRVAEQVPIIGGDSSLPEPDVVVLVDGFDDTRGQLPRGTDCLLVVEVAQTSHRRDRAKADIYAHIGVPEYWMLDLVNKRVERHCRPMDGERYASTEVLAADATLTLPETEVHCTVASLFGD